jgi:membrane protein DedA with SNARE-associated domain
MPQRSFQLANILSAILWVPIMLLPGVIGGWVWSLLEQSDRPELKLFIGAVVVVAIGGFVWYRMRRAPKPDAQAELDATVAELDEYREHRRRNDAA